VEKRRGGLVYFGKVETGERSPVRVVDPWNYRNTIPFKAIHFTPPFDGYVSECKAVFYISP